MLFTSGQLRVGSLRALETALAASTYLQTLAGLGILREQKHGREKYYINEALFNELAS